MTTKVNHQSMNIPSSTKQRFTFELEVGVRGHQRTKRVLVVKMDLRMAVMVDVVVM
jgi:hypothetical protein